MYKKLTLLVVLIFSVAIFPLQALAGGTMYHPSFSLFCEENINILEYIPTGYFEGDVAVFSLGEWDVDVHRMGVASVANEYYHLKIDEGSQDMFFDAFQRCGHVANYDSYDEGLASLFDDWQDWVYYHETGKLSELNEFFFIIPATEANMAYLEQADDWVRYKEYGGYTAVYTKVFSHARWFVPVYVVMDVFILAIAILSLGGVLG
jgi:hypothetical protein